MNLAEFTIAGTPSSDRGYDVDPSETPILQLESASQFVYRTTFRVKSSNNNIRASAGSPTLTLNNSIVTGQEVDALTPMSPVSISSGIPDTRAPHLWEVACVVNGGLDEFGRPDPDLHFSRFIAMFGEGGQRKILVSERDEYDPDYAWAEAFNALVDMIDAMVGEGIVAPAIDNEIPYSLSSAIAWTSAVLLGADWLGFGAVRPSSGHLRVHDGFAAHGQRDSLAAGAGLISWLGGAIGALAIGSNVSGSVTALSLLAVTQIDLTAGGETVTLTSSGLNFSCYIQTSSGSREKNHRSVATPDAGGDGSPVAIGTYAIPAGKVVALKIWVRGERDDSTRAVLYQTQWSMVVSHFSGVSEDATEVTAAVTPDDEADPAYGSVSVTYAIATDTLTVSKQNDSGVAMVFVCRIVVDEDDEETPSS